MLSAILISDMAYLTFNHMRSLQLYFPVPDEYLPMYFTIASSGARFSLTSSILMMVALGCVRIKTIRNPLRQRILLYSRTNRIKECLRYLIPTLILSLAFTLPVNFELSASTQLEGTIVQLNPSKTRLDPVYAFFVLGLLNLGLLGVLPFACLIYFPYKIMIYTNQRQQQNREMPQVMRMMNEISEKVSKSFIMMIIIFVILHSLRIVTSVGELYVLTRPNRHEFILELGYGVPMWLQAVVLIGELCTVMNACLNIIIYKYMNSSGILDVGPICILRCLQTTASTGRPVPMANVTHAITPVVENESSNPSGNAIRVDEERSLSLARPQGSSIPDGVIRSSYSSENAINMDIENKSCTLYVGRQGREYI